jgi:hypothetical protein
MHYCHFAPSEPASLMVVVDTEEEFDWSGDFSRANTSVRAMRRIFRIQRIFDEYRITPLYVIDYPVASQADGYRPLQEIHASGRCIIGAHLHPWVNPPFEEPVNRFNSFPGNLPRTVEASKIRVLSDCIAERFGTGPTVYKAGRYGLGPHTLDILEEQDYEVDVSVCPYMDYSAEGGPDFRYQSAWPYWFGRRRRLLELPLTVGFTGLLRRWGTTLHQFASRPVMAKLHPIGLLARLRLANRIWLSPEGYPFSEHKQLVRALYRDGLRVFSLAFHSPSVEPGHTPYVRSRHDLEIFLTRCQRFLDFFMGELGGRPTTPVELRNRLVGATS